MLYVVIAVGAGIVLAAGIHHHLETRGLPDLVTWSGENDDAYARQVLLDLLRDAREEMLLYDDGGPGNPVYDDKDFVADVRRVVDERKEIKLFCLFTDSYRTEFWNVLDQDQYRPRVQIKQLEARRDRHYKIIDNGRKGYVTEHQLNSQARPYRWFDCTKVKPRDMKRVVRRTMGEHIALTRQEFHAA